MKLISANSRIKILVVEDNPEFSLIIKMFLKELNLKNTKFASNYTEAITKYRNFKPDICMIDINLGESSKTGIDFAWKIRKNGSPISIIFLTSLLNWEIYFQIRDIDHCLLLDKTMHRLKLFRTIDAAVDYKILSYTNLERPNHRVTFLNADVICFRQNAQLFALPHEKIIFFYRNGTKVFAMIKSNKLEIPFQLDDLAVALKYSFTRMKEGILINNSLLNKLGLDGQDIEHYIMMNKR